jgi:hypothetical protein
MSHRTRPAALGVALLGAGLLLAGCTSSVTGAATPAGREGPPSERQMARGTWVLEYTVSASGPQVLELQFDADGGFVWLEEEEGNDAPETWELDGGDLSLCFNDCFARYEGSWREDHFEGSAENDDARTWEWTLLPGAAEG